MNQPICPAVAREHGYTHLLFQDEFDSLDTIDVEGSGKPGFSWYTVRPYKAAPVEPDDYFIKDSVLTLNAKDPKYNLVFTSQDPYTKEGWNFLHGVLEYKIRIPRPRANVRGIEKGIPAIWSLPSDKTFEESNEWVEADWLEYWGDGYYTTTFHHDRTDYHGGPNTDHVNNSNARGPVALNDGEWHTMTFLWEEGLVDSWIDDTVHGVRFEYKNGIPNPPCKPRSGDYSAGMFTPLDARPSTLFLAGSRDNPLEIDWVRIWSK